MAQTPYLGLHVNGPLGWGPRYTETGAQGSLWDLDANMQILDAKIQAIDTALLAAGLPVTPVVDAGTF